MRLREGFCAMSERYRPTPESSDGAGDGSFDAAVAAAVPVVGVDVALLCTFVGVFAAVVLLVDVLRVRSFLGIGVAVERVLATQAGRSLRVTVALTTWLSSDTAARRGGTVGVVVRRLAGRTGCGCSPETSRVPNLAFADDSRA